MLVESGNVVKVSRVEIFAQQKYYPSLDGMRALSLAPRGRKTFLPLLPSRRVTGDRGQRPPDWGQGAEPLGHCRGQSRPG